MANKLYEWDEWFKHRSFFLEHGVHYQCSQSSICQQVRNAASERGLRIRIADHPAGITVFVDERSRGDTRNRRANKARTSLLESQPEPRGSARKGMANVANTK